MHEFPVASSGQSFRVGANLPQTIGAYRGESLGGRDIGSQRDGLRPHRLEYAGARKRVTALGLAQMRRADGEIGCQRLGNVV